MKRISLLLASLTAIALFACSNDNSNSSAEDADYSPVKALQKAPVDITPYATGSVTVTGTQYSMSVSNVPYSTTRQYTSNQVTFNFSKYSYPLGAENLSYRFTGNTSSGTGTFIVDYVTVICGRYADGYYYGEDIATYAPMNIYTTDFAGMPAGVDCYVSFTGRCIGTALGGGPCSFSLSGWTGIENHAF
jgi:hypothetical protein